MARLCGHAPAVHQCQEAYHHDLDGPKKSPPGSADGLIGIEEGRANGQLARADWSIETSCLSMPVETPAVPGGTRWARCLSSPLERRRWLTQVEYQPVGRSATAVEVVDEEVTFALEGQAAMLDLGERSLCLELDPGCAEAGCTVRAIWLATRVSLEKGFQTGIGAR